MHFIKDIPIYIYIYILKESVDIPMDGRIDVG